MMRVWTPTSPEHRHRGDVAGLGDLLEDQRGVEHRQAETAIFLRHRHAEHAQLGELFHVVPRERAVHPARRALAELGLREGADGLDELALLVGQGREHGGGLLGRLARRIMRSGAADDKPGDGEVRVRA